MALGLVTGPAIEPVSVLEARRQCKVPDSIVEEDGLLLGLVVAARERGEAITGRQFIEATYDLKLDDDDVPCDALELPRAPLRSVVSVTYLDSAGATQTWSSTLYDVDAPAGPYASAGRLRPMPSATWPVTQSGRFNAVTVRFKAGYGTVASSVPAAIKQAMLLMIGAWYRNREDMVELSLAAIPLGALALLTPYKLHR